MRNPTPTNEIAANLRGKVEAVVEANRLAGEVEIEISGRQFSVHPDVFNPTIAPSGQVGMAFSALPWTVGKSVVDLGAGCGAFSVLMALNGAKGVISTDIGGPAVANMHCNVSKFQLKSDVQIRQGDGLTCITDDDSVDVIYCDFPFLDYRKPLSQLEVAYFDLGLNSIRRVIRDFSSSRFTKSELYICGSPSANAFEEELKAHPKLACSPALEINHGWINLELWRVTHRGV